MGRYIYILFIYRRTRARKLYYQIIKYNNQIFDNFLNFCYNIYVRRREEIGVNRPYPPRTRAFLQLGSPPVAARLPVFFICTQIVYSILYTVFCILYTILQFYFHAKCQDCIQYTRRNFIFIFKFLAAKIFLRNPIPKPSPFSGAFDNFFICAYSRVLATSGATALVLHIVFRITEFHFYSSIFIQLKISCIRFPEIGFVATQFFVVSPLTDAFVIYISNAADAGEFFGKVLHRNDFFE